MAGDPHFYYWATDMKELETFVGHELSSSATAETHDVTSDSLTKLVSTVLQASCMEQELSSGTAVQA